MSLHLTITLFAPETEGERGILLGLPHRLTFTDQGILFRFADHVGLGPEIMRLIERPLVDTVMVPVTKLAWRHTISPDDPERDQITKGDRTYGTGLREFRLDRDSALSLRTLGRLVPIAAPHAILQLARGDQP